MKHSVCSIEFSASDLGRAAAFYTSLFEWTFTPVAEDFVAFRSPDGLQGGVRWTEQVEPARLPLLRIEVPDIGSVVDAAARLHGGYTGFVDPLQGEWTINLRDPDGNLIRLARSPVRDAETAASFRSPEPATGAEADERPALPSADAEQAVVRSPRTITRSTVREPNANGYNGNGNGKRNGAKHS